jgi:hypothetical protein
MLLSDSVGGAEASRKGFSKRIPVNDTETSMPIGCSSPLFFGANRRAG